MKYLYKTGLLNSLGTLAYIVIVATVIRNGDRIFDEMDNWLGPIAFLLLFTLSALIVGSLILGKPIMLYLDGKKKESVTLVTVTILFLLIFTTIALIAGALIS